MAKKPRTSFELTKDMAKEVIILREEEGDSFTEISTKCSDWWPYLDIIRNSTLDGRFLYLDAKEVLKGED